jgi:ABC-type transport system involved in cytochrome c biogenesis permease component
MKPICRKKFMSNCAATLLHLELQHHARTPVLCALPAVVLVLACALLGFSLGQVPPPMVFPFIALILLLSHLANAALLAPPPAFIAQLSLAGASLPAYALVVMAVHMLVLYIPLMLALPVAALVLNAPLWPLLAASGLLCIGLAPLLVMLQALMHQGAALLLMLVLLPLLLPLFLGTVGVYQALMSQQSFNAPLSITIASICLALAISPWGAAAGWRGAA